MKNLENSIGAIHNRGLKKELRFNRYYPLIAKFQESIHRRIPGERGPSTVAGHSDIREEVFNGTYSKRAVIYLISNGCEWALKSAGGCTMCGHLVKQARKEGMISNRDIIHQFKREFKKIQFKKIPLLNLYNNGSFLNQRELPLSTRREILKIIGKNPDIRMLVLETRPEFVKEEEIKEIKGLLPGKHVEIAMGLELKDDRYRRVCLNKGFGIKSYNAAADIITRHLHLRTYVFLKPPFLSEKESIKHAVRTIEHAFKQGSTTVSLESCTVQDHTLVEYLYRHRLYKTPWLWSIIEVVKQVKHPGKLIIGLFQFYPTPGHVPFNCKKCSSTVLESLREYNRTLDRESFNGLNCQCKKKWKEILNEIPLPFEKRLENTINKLKYLLK